MVTVGRCRPSLRKTNLKKKERGWRGRTGGGHWAVLIARALKDEVCERLGAAGGLGHVVAREVVERSGENGAYVELSREVDDVDGRGNLMPRVVVAIGRE